MRDDEHDRDRHRDPLDDLPDRPRPEARRRRAGPRRCRPRATGAAARSDEVRSSPLLTAGYARSRQRSENRTRGYADRHEPEQLEREHEEPDARRREREERADGELRRDRLGKPEALDVPRDGDQPYWSWPRYRRRPTGLDTRCVRGRQSRSPEHRTQLVERLVRSRFGRRLAGVGRRLGRRAVVDGTRRADRVRSRLGRRHRAPLALPPLDTGVHAPAPGAGPGQLVLPTFARHVLNVPWSRPHVQCCDRGVAAPESLLTLSAIRATVCTSNFVSTQERGPN